MGRFSLAGLPGTTDALFERMRLYANALEGTSPLVFVGREDELRTLNERLHGARILVACFGLHNTETFMSEDLRLSRVPADAVTDIGPLNPGEGRKVLTETLDYCGASADNGAWLRHLRAAGFDSTSGRLPSPAQPSLAAPPTGFGLRPRSVDRMA